MKKESFEFSNIFSPIANDFEERKNRIGEKKGSGEMEFNEEYHLKGKPEWIVNLFRKIDLYCLANIKTGIKKACLKTYIRYARSGKMFAYIMIGRESLRIYLKLRYSELENPPVFIRDYSKIARGTWTELLFDNEEEYLQNETAMLDVTYALIDKSYKRISEKPKLARKIVAKPKVEPITKLEPVASIGNLKVSLMVDHDGYIEVNFKIHKSRKGLLEKILQDTIYQ